MTKLKQEFMGWLRIIVGGPMGIIAWGISGASAMAIVLWGLKTVALPLLMLKTASWGIWGFGVFRESKARREHKEAKPQPIELSPLGKPSPPSQTEHNEP